MNNDKPIKQYQELLDYILKSVDEIDSQTVATLGDREPEWWVQMMILRKCAYAASRESIPASKQQTSGER